MLTHHVSQRLHTRDRSGEAGVTLIEIVVSISILAIIAAPLALSLASAFRVTEETRSSLTASTNREVLSSWFTRDVGSVDAAGASVSTVRTCQGPSYTSGSDTRFVTLNRTRLESGVSVIDRATYWVQGTGRDMRIVRSYCRAIPVATAVLNAPVTGGTDIVVANEIGYPGRSQADTVRGPDSILTGHTAASLNPCDEFKCTMVIRGRFVYELRAQRRVFGAGVPLEVGKLYSSSYSADQTSGVKYTNTDINGSPAGQEVQWFNVLSLPVGLDGKNDLKVQFKMKSTTTGLWLEKVGSNYTFTSATEVAVDGDDSSGQWKISVPIASILGGGEYLVKTVLNYVNPDGSITPKQYGGANGFPLWFDWKPDQSVFVNGTTGVDTNTGLAFNAPVKTVAKAMDVARINARPMILLNGGTAAAPVSYSATINITTATSGSNRTFVGGLNDKWLRLRPDMPDGSGKTYTYGAVDRTVGALRPATGIVIDGATGIKIRQLYIRSGDHGLDTEDPILWSTYGMRIISGGAARVERSLITANAAGSAPPNASTGVAGTQGCYGVDGLDNRTTPLPSNPSCTGTIAGGFGGAGANSFNSGGGKGGDGGGGAVGGAGGAGCVGATSGIGKKGNGGAKGAAGTAGSRNATSAADKPKATAVGWTPGRSGSGGKGGDGGGGSGSGGGGTCSGARAASGAAGGGGGTGGTGGGGALGGGSGFGIYLFRAGSGIVVTNTDINTNSPGNGGRGGNGGAGAQGGQGGMGGPTCYGGDSEGAGGGGAGGGGGGGGGGPAGNSFGIWTTKDSDELIYDSAALGNFYGVNPLAPAPGAGGTGGAGAAGGLGGKALSHSCPVSGTWTTVGGNPGTASSAGTDGPIGLDGVSCKVWFGGEPLADGSAGGNCNPSS